ncbi:hypothetical protein LINPERPRIM_LOCUS5916 [Linum perenne]
MHHQAPPRNPTRHLTRRRLPSLHPLTLRRLITRQRRLPPHRRHLHQVPN